MRAVKASPRADVGGASRLAEGPVARDDGPAVSVAGWTRDPVPGAGDSRRCASTRREVARSLWTVGALLLVVHAMAGCSPASDAASPDVERVIRQPADWPAHPADPAAVALALLEGCSGVLPVVATDDRGFGIVEVLMGGPENLGMCTLRQVDGGFRIEGGGSVQQPGMAAGGFTVNQLGMPPEGTPDGEQYRDLIGIGPLGTARVRAAVGSHAVEATLGGRLFALAWPGTTPASLVVAFDAHGTEIGRLDAAALYGEHPPGRTFP